MTYDAITYDFMYFMLYKITILYTCNYLKGQKKKKYVDRNMEANFLPPGKNLPK